MSTEVKVNPFYCQSTHSPSFKIQITYPNISNLAYNFEMRLEVSIQKILPRISYELVHDQTFLFPKKEVIIQNLQPSKMYQIVVAWKKKGLVGSQNVNEQKTVYVCSEKVPEDEGESLEDGVSEQSYGQFVKGNIQGYFEEYYNRQKPQKSKDFNESVKSSASRSSYNQRPLSSNNNRKSQNKFQQKTPFCNSESMIKAIGSSDPFISKKNLQKYIIEGRKSTSVKDYLTTKDLQCFNSMNKLYKNEGQRRKHVEKTLLVSRAIDMFSEIYAFERENGISETNGFVKSELSKGKQFFKNDWFMGPFYSYDGNERQMKKKGSKEEELNNEG